MRDFERVTTARAPRHARRLLAAWTCTALALASLASLAGCEESEENEAPARAALHNDFNNPDAPRQPPWTICEAWYLGASFGEVPLGQTSAFQEVEAGLGYVLMVAAWDDPSCSPENCLPLASKQEEEVVPGQERTIHLTVTNHQGPCPPEGIQPIPQELYDRILELAPDYGFEPYEQRTDNEQCLE